MTDLSARLSEALADRYRLVRKLGEGGMAVVYLADDLKHNRKVALKVLRPELAAVVGAERFLAEIETTANLQHPHILPLFDSGEADGFLFFVMPYIDGETLRDRLDREKQLPVDEAVGIAIAVASALSVAHEQGVVHRDIKPGNILLSRGEPLVSDFGIAIAVTSSSGARLTETGLSVGTPYYMSPEQATGDREITAASDVYALGCVLYEMLVGEPPYMGTTAQAVLGKILTERPRTPTVVRAAVPANVEGAVLKALEKLPADRFRSASDFVRALNDRGFRYPEASPEAPGGAQAGPWRRRALAATALAVVSLGVGLWDALRPAAPAGIPVVLALDVGGLEVIGDVAISEDGTLFAMSAREPGQQERIWVRRVDEADFRPLAGTEGGRQPDFSRDGEWLVFRNVARGALVKVPVAGGSVVTVLDEPGTNPFTPTWGPAGEIWFVTSAAGLQRISDNGGGRPIRVAPSGNVWDFLPDGSGALGEVGGNVVVWDAAGDSSIVLLPGRTPRLLGDRYLAFVTPGGALSAVRFDPRGRRVVGDPVPIREDVDFGFQVAGFDVSDDGTLVLRRGIGAPATERLLVFSDRAGSFDTLGLTPRAIDNPRISPDGRFVIYGTSPDGDPTGQRLQLFDLLTGNSPTLETSGAAVDPAWSPDGTRVLFLIYGGDSPGLHVAPVDGSAGPHRVLSVPGRAVYPGDWREGIAVVNARVGANSDLWTFDPDRPDEGPASYLEADYSEQWPRLSPAGTHVAFESFETGAPEVWIREFPQPGGRWRVSEGGGRGARWSPKGDELYFWRIQDSGPDSLFSVPIRRAPDFAPGPAEFLFALDFQDLDVGGQIDWDVHPDGQFLLPLSVGGAGGDEGGGTRARHVVILHWLEELHARLGEDGR